MTLNPLRGETGFVALLGDFLMVPWLPCWVTFLRAFLPFRDPRRGLLLFLGESTSFSLRYRFLFCNGPLAPDGMIMRPFASNRSLSAISYEFKCYNVVPFWHA